MKLYSIKKSELVNREYYLDGTHKWYLPGVECSSCKACWGIVGVEYPKLDISNHPEEMIYRKSRSVNNQELERLKNGIKSYVPHDILMPPGTQFGPLEIIKAKGKIKEYNFIWLRPWTLLIYQDSFEKIIKSMINNIEVQPVVFDPKMKKIPENMLEFEIRPHINFDERIFPKGYPAACPACGRRNVSVPDKIIIKGNSIPENEVIFRGIDLPTLIFIKEEFFNVIKDLDLKGATFQEVEIV